MTAVVELRISSAVEPWERIGLQVVDGVAHIGGVTLRFQPGDEGVVAWDGDKILDWYRAQQQ